MSLSDALTQSLIVGIPVLIDVSESTTLSAAVDTAGARIVGIETPDSLTSTAITFLGCDTSDGTFKTVTNSSNTAISVTTDSTGKFHVLDYNNFHAYRYYKVKMGTAEGADRNLRLFARKY